MVTPTIDNMKDTGPSTILIRPMRGIKDRTKLAPVQIRATSPTVLVCGFIG